MGKDAKRVKGGTGWTVQLALDQGKEVYLFDIPSQTWYRSEHHYYVNDDSATLVAGSKFLTWGLKPPPFIKECCGWFPRSRQQNPRRNSSLIQSYFLFARERGTITSGTGRLSFVNSMKRVDFCKETHVYHPIMQGNVYWVQKEPLRSEEEVFKRRSRFQRLRREMKSTLRLSQTLKQTNDSDMKKQQREKLLQSANAAWQDKDTELIVK